MKLNINWDALGITATVACAIHCALLPLFLTSLPLFGINIVNNSWFETGMIALAFLVGGYSLIHGYLKHHHRVSPLLIFTGGFTFLVLKQVYHEMQYWFLVPAVILIVSAHYYNWRSCRTANHCHSADCNH